MKIPLLVVTVAVALSGCSSSNGWLDLQEGASWSYRIRTPHYQYVEEVKVSGRVPVGEVSGYVLESQLGQSHVAWNGQALVASRIGHCIFKPPIPIFDASNESKVRSWKGMVSVAGKTTVGTAELRHTSDDLRLAGLKVSARRGTLVLKVNNSTVETSTWLAKGYGLVKQEQRTDDVLDVSLERIRGS